MKMKVIAVLILGAAICQLGQAEDLDADLSAFLESKSIGDRFKQALEKFKGLMQKGNATIGVPVLDPYELEHKEFDLEHELIKLKGKVNDLALKGLSNYVVQNADFKFVGKKIIVDFLWSEVAGKTGYNVTEGLAIKKFPAYGAGDIKFEAKKFHFATEAKLKINIKADRVSVVSFDKTTIALGNLKLDLTGLLHDDELSALIAAMISDNVASFVSDFQPEITTLVNKTLLEVVNNILKDVPLKDMLKLIQG